MARRKERPKFEHKAGTVEYFLCLHAMTKWCEILHQHNSVKPYSDFLALLLQNDFYDAESDHKISKIAKLTSYPTAKISIWFKEIYWDILKLNDAQPELFCRAGEIKVTLFCSYFDSHGYFTLSLATIPRKGETFMFNFIKAKVGTDYFFVDNVWYEVEENTTNSYISLKGGSYSEYRDFALSKARFEGKIGFLDEHHMTDSEIDEILLGRPRYRTPSE